MITRSKLAIQLSKLAVFSKAKVKLEQYPTDSEIASLVLWHAYMQGDIEGKKIADLGCGTGILGIGALLLDAKFVYFVDLDKEVLEILKENLENLEIDEEKYEIINKNIEKLAEPENKPIKVDIVIQNPPFGTKEKHIDRLFLENAFKVADVVYSFHKSVTKGFISAWSKDNNVNSELIDTFNFPLKASMAFHKKKVEKVEVGCWKLFK